MAVLPSLGTGAVTHLVPRDRLADGPVIRSDDPGFVTQWEVHAGYIRLHRAVGMVVVVHGCQVWVDVIGRAYRAPWKPTGLVNGRPATRGTYTPSERAIRRYLLSEDAVIVLDPRSAGINAGTLRIVERGPRLAVADGYAPRAG